MSDSTNKIKSLAVRNHGTIILVSAKDLCTVFSPVQTMDKKCRTKQREELNFNNI